MRLFSRFSRPRDAATLDKPPPAESESVVCLHVALVPHWDNPADMGQEEKASRFLCEGCRKEFTAEEVRDFRATETERINQQLT